MRKEVEAAQINRGLEDVKAGRVVDGKAALEALREKHGLVGGDTQCREEYDFSNAKPNPYAKALKRQVAISINGNLTQCATEAKTEEHCSEKVF